MSLTGRRKSFGTPFQFGTIHRESLGVGLYFLGVDHEVRQVNAVVEAIAEATAAGPSLAVVPLERADPLTVAAEIMERVWGRPFTPEAIEELAAAPFLELPVLAPDPLGAAVLVAARSEDLDVVRQRVIALDVE